MKETDLPEHLKREQPGYFNKLLAPVRNRWQQFNANYYELINGLITLVILALLVLIVFLLKGYVQLI